MKKFLITLLCVAVCLGVGLAASMVQAQALAEWYPWLVKPSLTPPGWVFAMVWTLLYVSMGVSVALVIASRSRDKAELLSLFAVQLLLNFVWCVIFFTMREPVIAFLCIVLLDVAVALYALCSWRSSRAASALFWPYLGWMCFATYLNAWIMLFN